MFNPTKMRFTSDSICKSLFLPIKILNMKKLIIMLISVISIYSASAQKYTDQYIKDASKVAKNWLSDINNKKYDNAYYLLSKEVKAITKQDKWIGFVNSETNEFGDLKSREVTQIFFQSEIEGMEDGFYVVIDYDVNYELTENHTEKMILKQNDNSKWEILVFSYDFKSEE
tara:strand:- start:266 stop:778 length:513 start_codon:yes stop_codon:yes gene_type:complete